VSRPSSTSAATASAANADLIARVRIGDRAAASQFCRQFGARVRGLVAVRLGRSLVDVDDGDDIVQETLLEALERLPAYTHRSTGALVHWLGTLVESRIATLARRARTTKRGGGKVVRGADLGDTAARSLDAAAGDASPSAAVRARELDPALERALLALGQPRREIVYGRLVLEMEFAEIAAGLALPNVDSVRAQFHHAVQELRRRLGSEPPGT
jgi:RNA polymerase sigma factor (sigma-70 family)